MKASKNALLFVLITIVIDAIGLGIIIPSLPDLVAETAHVKKDQSIGYYGLILTIYAFMTFIFSPMVGNLSDRFGRRPILLLSVFGLGLDYTFMYFAPSFAWLVFGRALSGIFGASFTTAAAYIADISDDSNRTKNFGLIGAAFGIGFILGPGIGAAAATISLRAPFAFAALFSLINFVYGFFVLKESLPKHDRRAFEWKRANPIGAFFQISKFKKTRMLFVVMFCVLLANNSVHALWNYYTNKKFDWSITDVGISLVFVGVLFGLVQGLLTGKIVDKLGEKKTAITGVVLLFFTMFCIGIVTESWIMYVLLIPYAFTGIFDPALRSIVSKDVPSNEQGELQGVFTSLMSAAEIIGPPFMLWLYHFGVMQSKTTVSSWIGLPFFISAGIVLCGIFILIQSFRKNK